MEEANTCVGCGTVYPAGKRLCVRCGIDLKTSEPLHGQTKVGEEDSDVEQTRMEAAGEFVRMLLPGLFQPLTVGLSVAGLAVSTVIGWYAISALRLTEVTGGAAMIGLALVVNAQVMAWIITGELQSLINALVEMGGRMPYFLALVVLPLVPTAVLHLMIVSVDGW